MSARTDSDQSNHRNQSDQPQDTHSAHEAASQPLVSVCHFGPIYMTDEQLDDYDSSLITGDRFVDQQLSELLHV